MRHPRAPTRRAGTPGFLGLMARAGLAILAALAALVVGGGVAGAHAPHDDVADVVVSPTYAQDQTVFAIVRSKLMRSTDGGRTWDEIVRGLGDETEILARIGVSASDKRVMYLSTRNDGMRKSNDGGASWQPANRGLASLSLGDVVVSPVSADLVLVAGHLFGGLFRTSDGGASWSTVGGFGRVTAMTFLPDGSRLLVGDARGRVVSSADAGATWGSALTLAEGETVTALAAGVGPGSADVVFAATDQGHLFRSGNGGDSFVRLGDGLPDEEVRSLELSPQYAADGTLWASAWHSGVFRSVDEGETWDPMADGLTTDPQADEIRLPQFRTLAAGLDSLGGHDLFVGGFDGFFRHDGDDDGWDPVETLSEYVVGLAVSPDFDDDRTVAVTTYVKGAFTSQDRGETWRFADEGLTVDDLGSGNKFAPLQRLHNVVFSPDYASDDTIFSASWVTIVKSTNRGRTWKEIELSPPPPGEVLRQFVLAVSPSYRSDRTVFAATRKGEVFRSQGDGEADTWTQVSKLGERVRSLAVSPEYTKDRTLYAGTVAAVYTSSDAGVTWHRVGPRMATPPEGREEEPGALVAISPAYGEDGTLFAGTDNGLHVTRDAGQSWKAVVAGPLRESSRIEAVAVSPDYENDQTVIVSTRERGLLRSTDGGMSFRQVGTELLDANLLVADFSNPTSAPVQFSPTFATDRTIFAYAQTVVVRSTDGGDSWEILRLPTGTAVLESIGGAWGAGGRSPENVDGPRSLATPVGHLSVQSVLGAVAAGLVCFVVLRVIGVGGRGTGRALVLHLAGSVMASAIVLTVLAA
jgi:photosystem II stability/assembly factor-like uncharacterized protein